MEKKDIGNMTLNEIAAMCTGLDSTSSCEDCPLFSIKGGWCYAIREAKDAGEF